jgi:hypothetical protein
MNDTSETIKLRSLRLLHLALLVGSFWTVAGLMLVKEFVVGKPILNLGTPVIGYVACGLLVVLGGLALVLPEKLAFAQARRPGADPWAAWQSGQLLGWVLLEFATVAGAMASLLEGSWTGLAVAVVAWVLLGSMRPTQSRYEGWLARIAG